MKKIFIGILMLFTLVVVTGCEIDEPDVVEHVKCKIYGETINYRFEKNNRYDQKTYSDDGDVYIYNEDRFLLRVISNAECDIRYTPLVDEE